MEGRYRHEALEERMTFPEQPGVVLEEECRVNDQCNQSINQSSLRLSCVVYHAIEKPTMTRAETCRFVVAFRVVRPQLLIFSFNRPIRHTTLTVTDESLAS